MPYEALGLRDAALRAAKTGDLDLFRVPPIGLLRDVGITRGAAAGLDG